MRNRSLHNYIYTLHLLLILQDDRGVYETHNGGAANRSIRVSACLRLTVSSCSLYLFITKIWTA